MPPARRKTTRKQPRRGSAARTGDAALKRLNSSLDAAQDALTELRKNLGRGGRGVVNDVHKRVTDLRKDARKLNKSVRSELDQLQKSIAGGRPSTGARRTGGRKAATSKAGARKPAAARRKTAARSGAKRSAKSASSAKSARSAGSAGSKGG
jgi:hypothetical protein